MERIIVFGVGYIAENFINPELIPYVTYCIDNSIEKQGKEFFGKKIYSPEVVKKEVNDNFKIIIFGRKYYNEMAKQLKIFGLKENIHFVSAEEYSGCKEFKSAYSQMEWDNYVNFHGGFDIFSEEYKSFWGTRIHFMSTLINSESSSILDIGCGKMTLKSKLSDKVKYFGVDYVARDTNTIICDFNKHEFPKQGADSFFISGCLEYIEDVDWFLSKITNANLEIILSYNPTDYIPEIYERMSKSWKNHLSTEAIISNIEKKGFQLSYRQDRKNECYVILKFERYGT